MTKTLNELLPAVDVIEFDGDPQTMISGLCYDSRQVKPGDLFFATDGTHSDGHRFIASAVNGGARAVVYSDPSAEKVPGAAYVRVESPRKAMAPLSAAFYNRPAQKMKIVGVTGTDGKSTTVSFIHRLLRLAGYKAAFISTVEYQAGDEVKANPYRQSTPEAPELQRLLAEAAAAGSEIAVLETTSHSLSPLNNRLGTVFFDAAVFTNLTHEHLEFHGTMERYRDDKGNLFRKLKPEGKAVINADDPAAPFFASLCRKSQAVFCSMKESRADLYAFGVKTDAAGMSFCVQPKGRGVVETRLEMPGLFNISNAVEAVAAAAAVTGKSEEFFLSLLPQLRSVNGRMNVIDEGQPFRLIVDYAHTPGAFETVFPALRAATKGRLIAVFGSAGERDTGKRPVQGEIADRYADILILTDEDPRGEERNRILKEIAAGIRSKTEGENLFLLPDRREAVRKAVSLAAADDTVVLLGKGHESCIITADGKIPWNEAEEARKALKELRRSPHQ